MLATNYAFQSIMREAIGKIPPLHSCQEERGLALVGYGMNKVIIHGELSR
jgi:hypothetical protein